MAASENALAKCAKLGVMRIVSQEGDNSRNETQFWRGAFEFPVADSVLGDIELVGYFSLQQPQVEPPLS